MTENVLPTIFSLSYVPAVEDIAEMTSVGVRKSRRTATTGILSALVVVRR
jgi:hypothetical protein